MIIKKHTVGLFSNKKQNKTKEMYNKMFLFFSVSQRILGFQHFKNLLNVILNFNDLVHFKYGFLVTLNLFKILFGETPIRYPFSGNLKNIFLNVCI